MSDYKLVPFAPTTAMIEAAEEAHMPFGDMDLAIRMAVLSAPDVQGEPVVYAVFEENGNIRIWCADPIQAETLRLEYGDQVRPLYTAPQPASDESGLVKALEEIEEWTLRYTTEGHPIASTARKAIDAYRKQGGDV